MKFKPIPQIIEISDPSKYRHLDMCDSLISSYMLKNSVDFVSTSNDESCNATLNPWLDGYQRMCSWLLHRTMGAGLPMFRFLANTTLSMQVYSMVFPCQEHRERGKVGELRPRPRSTNSRQAGHDQCDLLFFSAFSSSGRLCNMTGCCHNRRGLSAKGP
ncbi:hypothetical protein P170DRAFT_26275 [Aspergillus steynii IBT 23096]|uniref:Uncharacterized protein n=1 Tax=Aspergillus steynii IBT 23096 TaxID=1392250 RepID=A0A2I2GPP5_9EURO|nr:uncharacterized protein P170DRAFT_26275 [Aspergillus steynii IBT 23096]PLB54852.1 hypothetical protein P170DRAFT_26275 [Aspergillus steynii IBT 23096]